ncbi:MAG TPA: hypothetical protein VFV32_06420 [Acidimicrobiales bacterium]|jgi:hypothetical protein|nr:hypothetical protein [Acidimicrobiales bacterium]
MTKTTLTMAGQLAVAGAARLRAAAPASRSAAPAAIHAHGVIAHQAAGYQPTTWTKGASAKPATFMVLDRKNRPSRLLSERSP